MGRCSWQIIDVVQMLSGELAVGHSVTIKAKGWTRERLDFLLSQDRSALTSNVSRASPISVPGRTRRPRKTMRWSVKNMRGDAPATELIYDQELQRAPTYAYISLSTQLLVELDAFDFTFGAELRDESSVRCLTTT